MGTGTHWNPWIYLVAAGVCEMGFTTFMKLSNGFESWGYNIGFAVSALLSFGLLNMSTRDLSLGTAYAVWTGIGAFGTAAAVPDDADRLHHRAPPGFVARRIEANFVPVVR
jgi:multidrug transporter EmrE-like cation transporter